MPTHLSGREECKLYTQIRAPIIYTEVTKAVMDKMPLSMLALYHMPVMD